MDYSEFSFSLPGESQSFAADVLPSYLDGCGFDSYVSAGDVLKAYRPASIVGQEDVDEAMAAFVADFPMADGMSYETRHIEGQDWNREWEENSFTCVQIGDKCVVRSPQCSTAPATQYDVMIQPRQAFGSGTHETTSLVVERMLQCNMAGKRVADVGCGTGVLGILAHMMGAASVLAFDVDMDAVTNALFNLEMNDIDSGFRVQCGSFEVLDGYEADFLLANITRNVLLSGMPAYGKSAHKGTELIMSGFLEADVAQVEACMREYGFAPKGCAVKNGWACVWGEKE